jgi:hypothetical protein
MNFERLSRLWQAPGAEPLDVPIKQRAYRIEVAVQCRLITASS